MAWREVEREVGRVVRGVAKDVGWSSVAGNHCFVHRGDMFCDVYLAAGGDTQNRPTFKPTLRVKPFCADGILWATVPFFQESDAGARKRLSLRANGAWAIDPLCIWEWEDPAVLVGIACEVNEVREIVCEVDAVEAVLKRVFELALEQLEAYERGFGGFEGFVRAVRAVPAPDRLPEASFASALMGMGRWEEAIEFLEVVIKLEVSEDYLPEPFAQRWGRGSLLAWDKDLPYFLEFARNGPQELPTI